MAVPRHIKIVVERHPEGYVAYPVGLKGVVVGEGEGPLVQPERFPHAVAQKEPRVEHGDLGFRARQQLAVDRDEHALVARIVLVLVGPHPTPQNSTPVRRSYIDA